MRLNPSGLVAVRCTLAVASCVCALVAALSMTARAGQLRSVTEGVYSGGQAARGQADLPGPMRGMSRQGDGRHHRTAAGRREFPLELERAPAGDSRRQDSEDDALQSAREPVPAAIDRPRGVHAPGREVSRWTGRIERRHGWRRSCFPDGANSLCVRVVCRRYVRWHRSSPARRESCRADESHRVSQFEHHLQPSDQGSRRPAEEKSDLLVF